jgi:purine-binding chemotaxis protein CheW
VLDIPSSSMEPPPEAIGTVAADYIHGVARSGKRLLILLNLEKLLEK